MDTTSVHRNSNAIRFSKRLYSSMGALGGWNATSLAEGFRKEFDNVNTDGMLGSALRALYDMRMQDLQVSLVHARRMQEVLAILDS
jgi:hypothetical protein